MCNNATRTGEKKSKQLACLDYFGTEVYSKLNCGNKVLQIVGTIALDNSTRRDSYKNLRIFLSLWLVTYDFNYERSKESKNFHLLPRFKKNYQVNITG